MVKSTTKNSLQWWLQNNCDQGRIIHHYILPKYLLLLFFFFFSFVCLSSLLCACMLFSFVHFILLSLSSSSSFHLVLKLFTIQCWQNSVSFLFVTVTHTHTHVTYTGTEKFWWKILRLFFFFSSFRPRIINTYSGFEKQEDLSFWKETIKKTQGIHMHTCFQLIIDGEIMVWFFFRLVFLVMYCFVYGRVYRFFLCSCSHNTFILFPLLHIRLFFSPIQAKKKKNKSVFDLMRNQTSCSSIDNSRMSSSSFDNISMSSLVYLGEREKNNLDYFLG